MWPATKGFQYQALILAKRVPRMLKLCLFQKLKKAFLSKTFKNSLKNEEVDKGSKIGTLDFPF